MIVCEDDAATRELLCDHLTADRNEALPAEGASDALRLCHFKAPSRVASGSTPYPAGRSRTAAARRSISTRPGRTAPRRDTTRR